MITVILAFPAEYAERAESLIDWMFVLHGRKKAMAIVLIAGNDCHDEHRTKVRLSAEVAFHHVDSIMADPANMFAAALEYSDSLRSPWVYLEWNCVPLVPNWMAQLELAHEAQHKKILGPFFKSPDRLWVDVHSVYAPEMNRMAGHDFTQFATKTRLIQLGKFEGRADLRDKSTSDPCVLYCGDGEGVLLKSLRSEKK